MNTSSLYSFGLLANANSLIAKCYQYSSFAIVK